MIGKRNPEKIFEREETGSSNGQKEIGEVRCQKACFRLGQQGKHRGGNDEAKEEEKIVLDWGIWGGREEEA